MSKEYEHPDVVVPGITPALLAALDILFPEKSADKSTTRDETMWQGGERSVVVFLHEQYRRENDPA